MLDVKGERGKTGDNTQDGPQNFSNEQEAASNVAPVSTSASFAPQGNNVHAPAQRAAVDADGAAAVQPIGDPARSNVGLPPFDPPAQAVYTPEADTPSTAINRTSKPAQQGDTSGLSIGRVPRPPRTLFGRSIFLRLVMPLSLIFLFSMGGAAFLNFTKFEQTYVTLAHERYDDAVRDLRFSIEESLGIGLSLGATQSTQVVIDRTVEQYSSAFELTILGTDGEILFGTQNATFGDLRDTQAGRSFIDQLIAETAAQARIGKSVTDKRFLSTTVIRSPLGEIEGYLVLGHNRSEVQDVITRLGDVLWRGVAVLSFVFVVIIAVTVFFAIRPMERRFAKGSEALAHLIETGDLAPVDPMGRNDDLSIGFSQARSIERELAAAEAQVMTVQGR